VTSALAVLSQPPQYTPFWSLLTLAVIAFLVSVVLSTLVSEDIGRSLRLSAALVPSILLFVLVKDHLDGVRQIRLTSFRVVFADHLPEGAKIEAGTSWRA
jgi:hypothetical protein